MKRKKFLVKNFKQVKTENEGDEIHPTPDDILKILENTVRQFDFTATEIIIFRGDDKTIGATAFLEVIE